MKKIFVMLLFFGGLWTIQQPINASATENVKDIKGENVITGKAYKIKVTFSDSSVVNYLYANDDSLDTWISGSTLETKAASFRINDLTENVFSTPIFVNQKVEINNGLSNGWWNVTVQSFFYPNGGIDLRNNPATFSFHPTSTSTPYCYSIKYNSNSICMGWSTHYMSFVTSTSSPGYQLPQISFIPY